MAHLHLNLFGTFQASLDHQPVNGFDSLKTRALLAYLADSVGQAQARSEVAGLLWPERPERAALNNLRHALANLRTVIHDPQTDPPYLLIDRETIAFNPSSDRTIDALEFQRWLREARQPVSSADGRLDCLERAAALYRGDFMAAFLLGDSPGFEEWILVRRETYRSQALEALDELAEAFLSQGDYTKAKTFARRQIEIEPWREEAHRQLMTALALSGQRSEALAQYTACRELLARDLKVEPGCTTLQLYERIRDGELAPVPQAAAVNSNGQIWPAAETAIPAITRSRHNLPRSLTRFIGRQAEIRQVQRLLAEHCLVTLAGAGGIGKTRLAIESVRGLVDQYKDGVWLVELAAVGDPALVPQVLLKALELRETAERSAVQTLREYLVDKHLLLVLDNCEHVIQACAELVSALLPTCADLTLLATSREVLGLTGETIYRVPSLALPGSEEQFDLVAFSEYEAIRLFVECGQAAVADFALTKENAGAILEICRRLDGIPLAIELAAARLRLLSVQEIVARLHDAFRLLVGSSRAAIPRHQTLRACIDWSYHLLSDEERQLLQELSVFYGGWTLPAAEAVCDGLDILERLGQLVDKSLVQIIRSGDGLHLRYQMLETIRQYALEKLAESGQEALVHERHLDYYTAFSEACEPRLRTGERLAAHQELRADLANLRAALGWSFGSEDTQHFTSQDATRLEKGLRLAGALCFFWATDGHNREIIAWLQKALRQLDRAGICCPPARVKADYTIGWLSILADEFDTIPNVQEGRALAQMIGDVFGYVFSTFILSIWPYWIHGYNFRLNEIQVVDFMDLAGQCGDRYMLAYAWAVHSNQGPHSPEAYIADVEVMLQQLIDLGNYWEAGCWRIYVGNTYLKMGQYDRAKLVFEEALRTQLEIHDLNFTARAYNYLAILARLQRDYPKVVRYCQAASEYYNKLGNKFYIGANLHLLGIAAFEQGDWKRAAQIFKGSRAYIADRAKQFTRVNLVFDWARLAVELGQPVLAAHCLGGFSVRCIDARQEIFNANNPGRSELLLRNVTNPDDHPFSMRTAIYPAYERLLAFFRERLDETTFEAAWNEGAAMSLDQILDEMEAWGDGIE